MHKHISPHGDCDYMGEVINLVNDFKVYNVIFNFGEYNVLENELIDVLDKKHIEYYSCIKELNIVLIIGLLLKNINLCDIISMESANMASAVIHMAIASEINKTLKRDNVDNEYTANSVHYEVGREVRNSIRRLGGTMPEDLSMPDKSLKELEKNKLMCE